MARRSSTPPGTDPTTAGRAASADGARTTDRARRVGVLSPHNSKETKAILNAVRALGHEPVWIREENVASWIEDGAVRVDPDADVVVNRVLYTKSDSPFEDLQLAALYGETAPVVNPPGAVETTLHKFRAGATLAAAGLPVPDALYGRTRRAFEERDDRLPGRAAHKRTVGTNGQQMSVVSGDETVGPRIANEPSFLQEFLESRNDRPADVRVYVVGDRIVGAMRRHAPDGDWRTNVALGGDVEDVTDELGSRPREIATDAAAALGLDVAGVDLMPVEDGWYVLEVNATAGFKGLYEATGRSVAPHIAQLAIERVGGEVDGSEVRELTSTLDDSVPECKPRTDDADGDGGTLGYTSRVEVGGTDGVDSVVAKSDTGAERTSIDTELAGRIGAGPLVGTTDVRSAAGGGSETRPLVDIDLRIGDRWRTVTASVTDRSRMSHRMLLGRDVLTDYTLDVSRTVEE